MTIAACVVLLVTLTACPSSHPAVSSTPTSSFVRPGFSPTQDPATGLRRPLKFPTIRAGQRCPGSIGREITLHGIGMYALGKGPVYFGLQLGSGPPGTYRYDGMEPVNGWLDLYTFWLEAPGTTGSVLIRGAQLDGAGPVGVFVGEGALLLDVPTSVNDRARGLMLLPKAPPYVVTANGWRSYSATTSIEHAGCYAFQIDGPRFSYVIVFQATR